MERRKKVTRIAPDPTIKGHWQVFGPDMEVIGITMESMLGAKCVADAIEAAYDAGYNQAKTEIKERLGLGETLDLL